MKTAVSFMLVIALVLGVGPQAWADFSIDQQPTEVPAAMADPGDILVPGTAPIVDDGDGFPGALMTLAVPALLPTTAYDTDAWTLAIPVDPMILPSRGLIFSLDDADPGPGLAIPDRQTELFLAPPPYPPGGVFGFTNGTEAMLGLLGNPPPIGFDDDVDAYETIPTPGPGFQAFFSVDSDAPGPPGPPPPLPLDPGDIYSTFLNGLAPALWCDDVTQMGIAPNEATPVDLDALTVIPPAYCFAFFGTTPAWCFLFSVDDAPVPPFGLDPGDVYITDCGGTSLQFADDVTGLGLVPNETWNVDIDALSVDDGVTLTPVPCWDNDVDWYWDLACGGTDCNDANPAIFPGAPDAYGDGIDSDCDGSDCFVATAAFGTELEGKIDALRSFRDEYLLTSPAGRAFVGAYYRLSPPVADYIAERGWLKMIVRTLLLPVIGFVSLLV